jgi:hypothetical protein
MLFRAARAVLAMRNRQLSDDEMLALRGHRRRCPEPTGDPTHARLYHW